MSSINLELPEWLAREIRERAQRDNVSVDTFVAAALAERVTAMQAGDYFAIRAARGDRAKYLAALQKAPDTVPEPGDQLED